MGISGNQSNIACMFVCVPVRASACFRRLSWLVALKSLRGVLKKKARRQCVLSYNTGELKKYIYKSLCDSPSACNRQDFSIWRFSLSDGILNIILPRVRLTRRTTDVFRINPSEIHTNILDGPRRAVIVHVFIAVILLDLNTVRHFVRYTTIITKINGFFFRLICSFSSFVI